MLEQGYQPAAVEAARDRFFVITGCSGGGKSSLLSGLKRAGYPVIEEPGRQVVREQALVGGPGRSEVDVELFLDLTISRTMHQMTLALAHGGSVIMDRCIVDQIAGPDQPAWRLEAARRFACNRTAFAVPPWAEIFENDAERIHGFEAAEASYHRLVATYQRLGYDLVILPKVSVAERLAFLLERLPPPHRKAQP